MCSSRSSTLLEPAPPLGAALAAASAQDGLRGGGVCLGPARVLDASGPRVQVALQDGRAVGATLALAFPYAPAQDDLLLVIGHGDAHWVIGVLSGRGATRLAFQGDVSLQAVGGTLRLEGDAGVEVSSASDVTVRASGLKAYADVAVEKFGALTTWVKDALTLRAGASQRMIDEEDHSISRRSVTLAREMVKIDANQVHLGH